MVILKNYFLWLWSIFILGCPSYQPQPLVPDSIFQEVEQSRLKLKSLSISHGQNTLKSPAPSAEEKWSFLRASQLMSAYSPKLKEVRAAYQKTYSLAQVKTPFPNPEIEIGMSLGSRLGEEGDERRIQPLVAFGFTVPLGRRISSQDKVNTMLAHVAYMQFLVQHRIQYLELRVLYLALVLTRERLKIQQSVIELVKKSLQVTQQLVEAGVGTALEVGIAQIELQRRELDVLETERELLTIEGQLSQLLGVASQYFQNVPEDALLKLPENPLPLERYKALLLANHPDLAILRMQYDLAEKELSLEISKAWPDIRLRSSFAGEVAERKKIWGFGGEIPLPIFDRHQQSITTGEKQRELVRTQYETATSLTLAELEEVYKSFFLAQKKFQVTETVILVKAQANLEIALQYFRSGQGNFLTYLDVERTMRTVLLDSIDAKIAMYRAWMDLERAVGVPLALFPEEQGNEIPSLEAIEPSAGS